jgi:hypothetical protein
VDFTVCLLGLRHNLQQADLSTNRLCEVLKLQSHRVRCDSIIDPNWGVDRLSVPQLWIAFQLRLRLSVSR